jgi:monoamine oxidase
MVHDAKKAWKRRHVLKASAAATLLATLPATKSTAASSDVDVVVIGAGVAGLAAARTLADLDYDVIVLEAADHIGGRLKTDWSLGAPFEVGAGWIHGPDGNPLTPLANKVNAETYVTDDENFQVFSADGTPQDYDEVYKKALDFEAWLKKVDDTFDGDQPLTDAMNRVSPRRWKDPVYRWMASAYTEFDTGGPLDQLSAFYFDEDEAFDGPDVVLTTGYDQILKPMAAGLDIRLDAPVDRVEYKDGEGATVYVGDDEYEASFVICTTPLGVLQADDITFEPKLPKKHRRSIGRIGMGTVTKIALKFDDLHWPKDVQYFGLMTKETGRWNYWLNYRTFSDENILLGLSVGSHGFVVEDMSEAEMTADAMKAVRTMFGAQVPDPVDVLQTRWSKNPYAKGAYSFTKLGCTPKDFAQLAKPVKNTLLFAGEHTDFAYHATVHGAYLSGLNAARIIEDDLAE